MRTLDIIMFIVLAAVASVILRRIYWAKINGLRTVMLLFFGAELMTDLGWIAVLFSFGTTMKDITLINIFFLYLPKLFAKVLFYAYVRKNFKPN